MVWQNWLTGNTWSRTLVVPFRWAKILAWLCVVAACGISQRSVFSQTTAFPGVQSEWHGFVKFDFEVDGKPVSVVTPQTPASGRPWVWHGEFFGHKPAPDIELLKRGFHVVYLRVPNLLGCPQAVTYWDECYRHMTEQYHLAPKVTLVGLSRGGLYCYNWAIANPEKVACIYGDAPVCDLKSWPGGRGVGKGSSGDWELAKQVYGFADDDAAVAYAGNPIDNLAPLARSGVPLLHVFGDADEVVPWEENTGLVAQRYRQLGGSIELIAKAGVNHHPHGLDDSSPIVRFIERHSLKQFVVSDPLRVACLGDSITAGARVDALHESYPARVQQIVGAPMKVSNFGVGGATLIKTGRPNVWQQLDRVAQFDPQVVIVSLGTNDTVGGARKNWEQIDRFDEDYAAMIQFLNSLPSVKRLMICTPTDMLLETPGMSEARKRDLAERRPRLLELCDRIREIAEQHRDQGVEILELTDVLTDHPERVSADGVHPNPAGYAAIAEVVASQLLTPRD